MKKAYGIIFLIVFLKVVSLPAQGINLGFEQSAAGQYTSANAVAGWTVQSASSGTNLCSGPSAIPYIWNHPISGFRIRQTPISHPSIGVIGTSPLSGNKVVQLNSTVGSTLVTSIRNTFSVSPGHDMLYYSFCGSYEDGNHICCQQAYGKIRLFDCSGTELATYSLQTIPTGYACVPPGTIGNTYTVTGTVSWTNWQTRYIDLTAYTGSCVTIEVTSADCSEGSHYGNLYFDAQLATLVPVFCNMQAMSYISSYNFVGFCPGSATAVLSAPLGYSFYQWISSAGLVPPYLGGAAPSLTISNPVAGSVFTLITTNAGGAQTTATYTLTNSTINTVAAGASPSCPMGSSGSATVLASGSSEGYSYSWLNASGAVVGTGSQVANLPPGTYTVNVAGLVLPNNCGQATATVSVGAAPPGVIGTFSPFCSGSGLAYLSVPGGSGYQWFHNAIPLGTTSSITIPSPVNGDVYLLTYTSAQGCNDSLSFMLDSTAAHGNLSFTNNNYVCPGASGGAVVVLNHAPLAPSGINSFSVVSAGTTPAYSNTLFSSGANTFSLSNLPAGGTYSVTAFDGFCKYQGTFSINTVPAFNFSVGAYGFPPATPTACSGHSVISAVIFSTQALPGQYTYSRTPLTFITSSSQQTAVITPTVGYGSSATLVYSVTVTPTLANCPQTKTFAVVAANPIVPTVAAIPDFCLNAPAYTISVNPPGGIFAYNTGINAAYSSVLIPSLALAGVNTLTYSNAMGGCAAKATVSFVVHPAPVLQISSSQGIYNGNAPVCAGQSLTLSIWASNAASYGWNNFATGDSLVIPAITAVYTATGSNTYSCYSSQDVTVTTLSLPAFSISGNTLICDGQAATLTASGAYSYQWSNGPANASITVSPPATTTYTLTGFNGTNGCTSTEQVTLYVSACTGLNALQEENSFKFYPNPAVDALWLETGQETRLLICNNAGATLFEQVFGKGIHKLNISGYAAGIYFLRCTSPDNASQNFKIVKVQ